MRDDPPLASLLICVIQDSRSQGSRGQSRDLSTIINDVKWLFLWMAPASLSGSVCGLRALCQIAVSEGITHVNKW